MSLNVAERFTVPPVVMTQSGPAFTTGGWFAIVAVVVAAALRLPFESVMTSVTLYVPVAAYVWAGVAPEPLVPSPKSQA